MIMRRPWLACGAFALCLAFPDEGHASSILFTNYVGEGVVGGNAGRTIGTEFTVGAVDLQILSLGVYDDALDGLTSPNQVGIWRTADQALVVSATVPAGTVGALIEDWRFTSVAPVTLTANTLYRIAALVGQPNPFDGTFSLGTGVSNALFYAVFSNPGPLSFPNQFDTRTHVFANAEFQIVNQAQPVPEPASLLLLGTGAAALAARRRRRPRST